MRNEKFNNLYSSPDIVRMIELWTMRWEEHIAYSLVWKLKGRGHFEDLQVRYSSEDNIKIKLKNRVRGCRLDYCGSEYGLGIGCCENDNEPSGTMKYTESVN
jgi:hypothetical protein